MRAGLTTLTVIALRIQVVGQRLAVAAGRLQAGVHLFGLVLLPATCAAALKPASSLANWALSSTVPAASTKATSKLALAMSIPST